MEVNHCLEQFHQNVWIRKLIGNCYPPPLLHPHPHTLPYPIPFRVGDAYSRRNQVERGPSGLLELISQVGDPQIAVFKLSGGLLFVICLCIQCVPSYGFLLKMYFTMIFLPPMAFLFYFTASMNPPYGPMHAHLPKISPIMVCYHYG